MNRSTVALLPRQELGTSFISRSELQGKWDEVLNSGNGPGNYMPNLEAANLGPVPVRAFKARVCGGETECLHPSASAVSSCRCAQVSPGSTNASKWSMEFRSRLSRLRLRQVT
jgi:hypothetical protein